MKRSYPTPLSIPPSCPTKHTHTFILLHGRGSNAERFGNEFLQSTNISTKLPTVKFIFPTAKKRRATALKRMPINQWFDNYFLTDPNRRTDIQIEGLCETAQFLRALIEDEAKLLGEGGYGRVVLGGLSQGCAASMFALLGGGFGEDGSQPLAGFVGMSGWLPFEAQMRELCIQNNFVVDSDGDGWGLEGPMDSLGLEAGISSNKDVQKDTTSENECYLGVDTHESPSESSEDENYQSSSDDRSIPLCTSMPAQDNTFDPFAEDSNEDNGDGNHTQHCPEPPVIQALNHVRDILDLPPLPASISMYTKGAEEEKKEQEEKTSISISVKSIPSHLRTPVFLGHGSEDPKVVVQLGEKMTDLLSKELNMDVTWKVYDGFGHWYKVPDEIDDIICFLQDKVGVPVV